MRSMNRAVTARGRESAKNITQGSDEKDGARGHNGPAVVERSLERCRWIVDRLDRPAQTVGPGAQAPRPASRAGSAPSCRRSLHIRCPTASSIPATSLSCMAPKSRVTRDQPMSFRCDASARAPAGLCAASIRTSTPRTTKRSSLAGHSHSPGPPSWRGPGYARLAGASSSRTATATAALSR